MYKRVYLFIYSRYDAFFLERRLRVRPAFRFRAVNKRALNITIG